MKKDLELVGLCTSDLTCENELTKGKIYTVHLCEKVANKIKRIGITNDKNKYAEYNTTNLSLYYKVSEEVVEKLKKVKNKNNFNIGDIINIKDKKTISTGIIVTMYSDFLFCFQTDGKQIFFNKGLFLIKTNEGEKVGININKTYIKECMDKYSESIPPTTFIDDLKDFCSRKMNSPMDYIYDIKTFNLDTYMMLCVGSTKAAYYMASEPEILEHFKPIILAGLTYDYRAIEDSVDLYMENDVLELNRDRLVVGTISFVITLLLRTGELNKIFEF